MKFLRRNYPSAVAGLISFVSLMSYAPLLQAEAELPLRVQNNQAETFQFTSTIAEDIHEVQLLPLVENNQAETIRPAFKNTGNLNENALPPLAEDNQAETLQSTVETANDTNQQQELPPVEDNRVQTLQPTIEIANDTDREQWPSPVEDNQVFWLLLIDQLEYRNNDGSNTLNWDAQGWVGGDYRRIWLKTEGEVDLEGDEGTEAEIQVLYGQLIAPYWDLQVGLRYDRLDSSDRDQGRAFAVVGVQGLTPYLFEVDAALFISEDGDVSARLAAEYELLLTQRLVLQPELEVNLALQEVEEFGVGTGLNDIELGLRLRYEVTRKFAPYVGISWTRKFGAAADFAREEGESTDNFSLVGGLRLLF
ncbi:MAG TPA: copper resistance protein CopB [Cyanobacteria bacterium UBA8803]|nr:copper resistance protein CopB [Cyanobacteria bacterium UBA9273]HBL58778.1 copper resistance protein CopB [Cyanobacteria bacterium UBA8803]